MHGYAINPVNNHQHPKKSLPDKNSIYSRTVFEEGRPQVYPQRHLYTADMVFDTYMYIYIYIYVDLRSYHWNISTCLNTKIHWIVKMSPSSTDFPSSPDYDLRYWAFHISVVDGYGFGRDSTFLSASFQPDVEQPWDFYQDWKFSRPKGEGCGGIPSRKLTEKIEKGKDCLPTIHFRVRTV